MKLTDERIGEVFVTRDWAQPVVELHVGSTIEDGDRIIRLTGLEARRLAALILFQAARLQRPRVTRDLTHDETEQESGPQVATIAHHQTAI